MNHTSKPAFSLLELVFVIVILGIVSSIGSQIIVQVYDSYISQRALHRSSVKTELAAVQLVNRLTYSIPHTVIGRKDANTIEGIDYIPVGTTDYTILEWIAADEDSFGAISATTPLGRRPRWSGYADVDSSTIDSLATPGSRLTELNEVIANLSPKGTGIGDGAVLFSPPSYNAHTVGYSETTRSTAGIHTVLNATNDTTLALDTQANRTIREHYKFTWTAYAVVPTNPHVLPGTTGTVWDLRLYYDFQPWDGETYTNGNSVPLLNNVSVFKFSGNGATIRIKLCQRENIGDGYTINTCKEKAVIR